MEQQTKNITGQQQAQENLSNILNPINKYKRTQEEILKGVFKE